MEAYLEEAAGMVMPHRYVGVNYILFSGASQLGVNYMSEKIIDIEKLILLSHRATRRRSGAKLRNPAATM